MEARSETVSLSDCYYVAGFVPRFGVGKGSQDFNFTIYYARCNTILRFARRGDYRVVSFSFLLLYSSNMSKCFLYDGRSNEDGVEWRGRRCTDCGLDFGKKGQVYVRGETLCLAAKVIAIDSDVETSDKLLATLLGSVGRFSEEDQSGASSPCWFPLDSTRLLAYELRNGDRSEHT